MRTSTRKRILGVGLLLFVVVLGAGLIFGLPLACKSQGERRLVGSWEFQAAPTGAPTKEGPAAAETPPPTKGGTADKVQDFFKNMGKALEQWAAAATPQIRVTFERDGTFSESMGYGGRRQVVTGRWELAEPGDDRVVVRVFNQETSESQATELTITFQGDDVMLYPAGMGQPIRMVRRQPE